MSLELPRGELTRAMISLETTDPPDREELEVYDRVGDVDDDDFKLRLPGGEDEWIDLPPRHETFEVG